MRIHFKTFASNADFTKWQDTRDTGIEIVRMEPVCTYERSDEREENFTNNINNNSVDSYLEYGLFIVYTKTDD